MLECFIQKINKYIVDKLIILMIVNDSIFL